MVSKKIGLTAAPRLDRHRALEFEAAVITAFGPQALATGEPTHTAVKYKKI